MPFKKADVRDGSGVHCLYVLLLPGSETWDWLYIGVTSRPHSRLRLHTKNPSGKVCSLSPEQRAGMLMVIIGKFSEREVAERQEAWWIRWVRPPLNTRAESRHLRGPDSASP